MEKRDQIRYRLSVNHLSFTWLINMLGKRGIKTTAPVMSGIVAGTRSGPLWTRSSLSLLPFWTGTKNRSAANHE